MIVFKKLVVVFLSLLWPLGSQAQGFTDLNRLTPPHTAINLTDEFGHNVSVDGNTAIVGSPQNTEKGFNAGKAYVFEKSADDVWRVTAELYANAPSINGLFGAGVLIKGEYAFVGATFASTVTVFHKTSEKWIYESTIAALDPQNTTLFGTSICLTDAYLAIGAPAANGASSQSGAVYIFKREGQTFVQFKKIFPSGTGTLLDKFGQSLSSNSTNLFVGSSGYHGAVGNPGAAFVVETTNFNIVAKLKGSIPYSAGEGTCVSASETEVAVAVPYIDNGDGTYGLIYVFEKASSGWADAAEDFQIKPSSNLDGNYGTSMMMKDDLILIGGQSGTQVDLLKKGSSGWADATLVHAFKESDLPYSAQYGSAVAFTDDNILIGAFNFQKIDVTGGAVFAYEKQGADWTDPLRLSPMTGPSLSSSYGRFGAALDINGDFAIVGAPNDNANGANSGAAYVYKRSMAEWKMVAQLRPSNYQTYDLFGSSVSITQDRAVVSAPYRLVDGNLAAEVYVFEMPASGWTDMTESQIIESPLPVMRQYFGYAVEAAGSEIVVSQTDPGSSASDGMVFVFERSQDSWTLRAKLDSPKEGNEYGFGASLAYDGKTIAVGAPYSFSGYGQVYIFEKPETGWIDTRSDVAVHPSDFYFFQRFGSAVDVYENTIIVGAPSGGNSGTAYVFVKGDGWTSRSEDAKLQPQSSSIKRFGTDVAIWGDAAIVSTPDQNGSALCFKKQNGQWMNSFEYGSIPPPAELNTEFGAAVAMYGDHLMIGAPVESSSTDYNSGAVHMALKDGTILKVTSTTPDGFYKKNDKINIKVIYSQPVFVAATPTIDLVMYDGKIVQAVFDASTDSSELNFTYTVGLNDSTSRLSYANENSLHGQFFQVFSGVTHQVTTIVLPSVTSVNSLGKQTNISVSGIPHVPPVVTGVTASDPNTPVVYPNPFDSEIYLVAENIIECTLVDQLGRPVPTGAMSNNMIDSRRVPSGFYILRVRTKLGTTNIKVIKD